MAAALDVGCSAMRRWRARADVQALDVLLNSCVAQPPASAASFASLFRPFLDGEARWLGAFFAEQLAALRQDPLAALQMRTSPTSLSQGLALFIKPGIEMTLTWVDHAALSAKPGRQLVLSPSLSLVLVIAHGGLIVRRHRLVETADGPRLTAGAAQRLDNGALLVIDNRQEAVLMEAASEDALLLRITCQLPERACYRAFDAHSGVLLQTGLGDDRASRMLPLLAVARLCGEASRAIPVFKGLSHHSTPMVRWSAMREWIAADPVGARHRIARMAAQDADEGVRAAAAATLALLSAHVQQEATLCPA